MALTKEQKKILKDIEIVKTALTGKKPKKEKKLRWWQRFLKKTNLRHRWQFLVAIGTGLVFTTIIFSMAPMNTWSIDLKWLYLVFCSFFIISWAVWLGLMILLIPKYFNLSSAAQLILAFVASIWVLIQVYGEIPVALPSIKMTPIQLFILIAFALGCVFGYSFARLRALKKK